MLQLLRVTPDHSAPTSSEPIGLWGTWSPETTTRALITLRQHGIAAVLLATCHRLECYWWGSAAHGAMVRRLLVPDPTITWQAHSGEQALRHLMRVAAGLESERRGEPEILGQVRAAWRLAHDAGTTTPSLDHTFRGVISAARQLRRRLGFTDGAAQGATIGAATIALVDATWRTLTSEPAAPRRWLVVGTGAVGTSVAEALRAPTRWPLAEPRSVLMLANRTPARAAALAHRVAAETIPWEAWPEALPEADVVIFAAHTAAPLVSVPHAAAVMAARLRPTLWVDLGAPPNCASGAVPGLTRRTLRDLATVGAGTSWDDAVATRLVDQELDRWHRADAHRQQWYAMQHVAATPIAV
jgi:glutamyl-tRNA reductase